MKKFMRIGAALFVAVAMLALIGCPQATDDPPPPPSKETGLASLSLNETAAVSIAEGVDGKEWSNPAFNPAVMVPSLLFAESPEELEGAAVLAVPEHNGAKVSYAKGANDECPEAEDFVTSGVFDFNAAEYVYVQVTAQDGVTKAYYKAQILVVDSEARINSFRIGGKTVTGYQTAFSTDIEEVVPCNFSLNFGENVDAAVEIGTVKPGATWEIALVKAGSTVESAEFVRATTVTPDDGDVVYIKITSSDGQTVIYYGVKVSVLRIQRLTLGGMNSVNILTGQMLANANDLDDRVYVLHKEAATDAAIDIVKADGVTVQYAIAGAEAPAAAAYTTWAAGQTATFEDGDVLWLKASASGFPDKFIKYAMNVKWNDFSLTSVKIGEKEASEIGIGGIAPAIVTDNQGAIAIAESNAGAGALIVATPTAGRGATITGYALGTNTTPTFVEEDIEDGYETTATIANANSLFIRVRSEAGNMYYYRIAITVQSSNATLQGITVGGISLTELGTPAATYNAAVAGEATLSPAQLAGAISVAATGVNANVTTTFAYTTGAAEPTFADVSEITGAAAGGFIWVKSVAEDGVVTLIYKLLIVSKNNVATLSTATINSGNAELPIPNANYADAAAEVKVFGSSKPVELILAATATDTTGATVSYAITDSNTTVPAAGDWETSGAFEDFTSGQYMVVKVVAENEITTLYYKWRISFGSDTAALATAPGLFIAGVPVASHGTPANAYNGAGIASGAIYLNNTQNTTGKSVVVMVDDADINSVAFSTNNATDDTTVPTSWSNLTKDGTDPTKWTGALTGNVANNRRLYIRLIAEDAVTTFFYRIQVTVSNNASTLTNLTIDGVTVPANSRGTPAGSWDATDLVAGELVTTVKAEMEVVSTWNDDNTMQYAKTSTLTEEPAWGDSGTLNSITDGDYIWIKGVNTANPDSYRNIYVIRVIPAPFSVTIGEQTLAFTAAAVGTPWTSGTTAFTNMGNVILKQSELASLTASVTVNPALVGDGAVIVKYTVPYTQDNVAIADFNGASGTLAASAFKEKDIIQVRYTPNEGTPRYYAINIRRAVDIPYVARGAIDVTGITEDVAWATAPALPLDRVYVGDSGGWGSNTDYSAANPSTIKVLWNEDGIYYFATVYDSTPSLGNDHLSDNIEFFLSEDYAFGATGNWNSAGGQYRVGRNNNKSGDDTGRITSVVSSTDTGYTIKAQIAWETASGTVAGWNNKLIGIDPQLAYSRSNGARDGVVLWNNYFAGSYQQKGNTGIAYLIK